jgi:tRNA threonylcarbamoyladenosine biosynthesis protein TsaE
MKTQFTVCGLNDYSSVTSVIDENLNNSPIVLLEGQLGAGKTQLVKLWVQHKGGHLSDVSSPSFAIVNSYHVGGQEVHHFDLYRIKHIDELEEIGFYEYLESGSPCFIEWPDNFTTQLPTTGVQHLIFEVLEDQSRHISYSVR